MGWRDVSQPSTHPCIHLSIHPSQRPPPRCSRAPLPAAPARSHRARARPRGGCAAPPGTGDARCSRCARVGVRGVGAAPAGCGQRPPSAAAPASPPCPAPSSRGSPGSGCPRKGHRALLLPRGQILPRILFPAELPALALPALPMPAPLTPSRGTQLPHLLPSLTSPSPLFLLLTRYRFHLRLSETFNYSINVHP